MKFLMDRGAATQLPSGHVRSTNQPHNLLKTLRPIKMLVVAGIISTGALYGSQASAALDVEINFDSSQTFPMNCSGNCPTVSSNYAREGRASMRSYVNRKTSTISYRTEGVLPGSSPAKKMTFDRDYWIGFSTLFPRDWTPSGGTGIVAQLHASSTGTGGPNFVLKAGRGNWQIMSRGNNVTTKTYTLNSAYEDVGRWVDWVIHYKPSTNSNGILKVWKDGALVLDQTGRSTAYPDKEGPYWKMGIYEAWKDRNCCDDISAEKIVYHDALRIASGSEASYNDVAPGGGTAPDATVKNVPEEEQEQEQVAVPQPEVADDSTPAPEEQASTQSTGEPMIDFANLQHKGTVSGDIKVIVDATHPDGIKKVLLRVGKKVLGEDKTAPYEFQFDSTQYAGSEPQLVRLKAVAFDNNGNRLRKAVRVYVE